MINIIKIFKKIIKNAHLNVANDNIVNIIINYYNKNIKINNMLSLLKDIKYINKIYYLLKNLNNSIISYLFIFINKYFSNIYKEIVNKYFYKKYYYYSLSEKLIILNFKQELFFPKIVALFYGHTSPLYKVIMYISIVINEVVKYILKEPCLILLIIFKILAIYAMININSGDLDLEPLDRLINKSLVNLVKLLNYIGIT
uniref:Uncharacterized protein n=1 Tax=Babesia rodhaini TaxID=5870 RepID=A0A455R065_BABRO|nr:hypothetical protein [Babesia rodhaini]